MSEQEGLLFERRVFGCDSLAGIYDRKSALRYVKRRQRSFYKWSPSRPHTDLGRRLYSAVQRALRKPDVKHLKLYVALGSPLDWFFGVDAFFSVGDRVVTIDISIREKRIGRIRADVLITRDNLHDEYALRRKAELIARKLDNPMAEVTPPDLMQLFITRTRAKRPYPKNTRKAVQRLKKALGL